MGTSSSELAELAAPPAPRLLATEGPLHGLAICYARNILLGTAVSEAGNRYGALPVQGCGLVHVLLAEHYDVDLDELDFSSALREYVVDPGEAPGPILVDGWPFEENLRRIGAAFRLDDVDLAIVQLMGAHFLVPGLTRLTDVFGRLTTGGAAELAAVATGLAVSRIEAALAPAARLVTTGLLTIPDKPATLDEKLVLDLRLLNLLSLSSLDVAGVRDRFLPRAPPPRLAAPDFAAVAGEVALARRLIAEAVERREPGINILIHGPSGCGKSELASLLASEAGVALHQAGATDADGSPLAPPERLGSLERGQRLLEGTRSALLFDDLDDLFDLPGSGAAGRAVLRLPKAWFGALLEKTAVPTLWAARDATVYDPWILRRFSLAIALTPATEQRRFELLGGAGGAGTSRGTGWARASRYPVSAGELVGALRVAGLAAEAGDEARVVTGLLETAVRLTRGAAPQRPAVGAGDYRLGLVNASMDLPTLVGRIEALAQDGGVTLCLHGPSGTGKSEFVRHLAERLGRPLVARRVSDIESKWVGDAEKNLAEAFQEAERERAVLLFDEADSFLRDRREARHRWEVTLTNEFLQRLEETRGVVACTTNFLETLDQAVLRRFSLRIAFDYLRPEQAEAMFRELIGPSVLQSPDLAGRLASCGRLALGDFGVVRRRAELLGRPVTAEWLLEELSREAEARGTAPTAVGFRAVRPCPPAKERAR